MIKFHKTVTPSIPPPPSLGIYLRLGSNYHYIICHWTGVMERPNPPPTQGEWIPFLRQVSANGEKDYINLLILKGQNYINKKMPQKILTKTNQFSISTERLPWKSNTEQIKTRTFSQAS